MRIRRGPATVTGERSSNEGHGPYATYGREGRGTRRSGSQETLVAVASSQGEDPE